jgi:hypothetical protein
MTNATAILSVVSKMKHAIKWSEKYTTVRVHIQFNSYNLCRKGLTLMTPFYSSHVAIELCVVLICIVVHYNS